MNSYEYMFTTRIHHHLLLVIMFYLCACAYIMDTSRPSGETVLLSRIVGHSYGKLQTYTKKNGRKVEPRMCMPCCCDLLCYNICVYDLRITVWLFLERKELCNERGKHEHMLHNLIPVCT